MTTKDLTTLDMEIILMKHFDFVRKIIVPNVTDMSGLVEFETDLLILSKSNYATGIEIKISKSDLLNDLKKRQYGKYFTKDADNLTQKCKKYYSAFKYFYYAVPDFLVEEAKKVIHPFCGILSIEINDYEFFTKSEFKVREEIKVNEVRKPKFLNNNRWNDKQVNHLLRLGNMRVYALKNRLNLV